MTSKNSKVIQHSLREQAEALLRSSPPEHEQAQGLIGDELLHELRLYQTELEMQNQELRQAQLALEASRNRYANLFDFAPVGYLSINADDIVLECNLTANKLLGLERKLILNKRLERVVDDEFKDIWYAFLQQARQAQEEYSDELPFRTANGTDSDFHVDCLVIRDKSELPTLRITLTDITAQKKAEMALRNTEKELISKQNALRDNLAEAIRMQVAIQTAIAISHNINQPLTAINFCAEAAVNMLKTGIKEPQKLTKSLEIISKESLRAGEAIPTLLSSLCAGDNTSQHSIDINTAVNSAINLFALNNPLKPIVMQHLSADLPMVIGNGLHIEQVLMSLMQNSLEIMQPGNSAEVISVSTSRCPTDPNRVQVTVSDNGAGAPDNSMLRKMFEPFFTSKTNGLGLGLAICKTLLEKVGGHIWAEENSTTGLTVKFTLLIDNGLNMIG